MLRLVGIFCVLVMALPACCQSTPKWQVGTITEVKVHQTSEEIDGSTANYDVSVKVGDTIYVVLYTPPLREETVKFAAGRNLLVFVGKGTLQYNDLLGQSHEVPIKSHRLAINSRGAETVSRAAQ